MQVRGSRTLRRAGCVPGVAAVETQGAATADRPERQRKLEGSDQREACVHAEEGTAS